MAELTELTEEESADVDVIVRETNKLIDAANADALVLNPDAPQLPQETPETYLQRRCDEIFAGLRAQAAEVEDGATREALKTATPEVKEQIKQLLNVSE